MELTLALPVVLALVELSADFHHPEVESLAEAAAGLEEQSEAAAEPSVEVAAPVGAEKVEEPSVEVVPLLQATSLVQLLVQVLASPEAA